MSNAKIKELRELTPKEIFLILSEANKKYPGEGNFAARQLYIRQLKQEARHELEKTL